MQVIDQMQAVEKVEIGTHKGKRLTLLMRQVSAEFNVAVRKIKGVKYDVTDISAKDFDDDFYDFRRCSFCRSSLHFFEMKAIM